MFFLKVILKGKVRGGDYNEQGISEYFELKSLQYSFVIFFCCLIQKEVHGSDK